ncbi:serine hydrolase [Streptomyces sp. 150FB]|uniref:serine hydrolase n=1 Tax=Streptomyces sp. 150FB TaxID=1576605 RepID=UPI001F428A97|nr:serine hydrolase [Streptomyces sp. 150FB]
MLAGKIASIDKAGTASVSVAVLDTGDGRGARYGVPAGRTYDTASIAKVDILAAVLLHAQDQHRSLTSSEKSYATSMIHVSDNASADALWGVIGGAPGLDAANRRLGLDATTAGTGGHWGLTQTTAGDQLVLLGAVFGDGHSGHSALNAASRTYIRGLMGGISADQDWGVSAAGKAAGLKNGWLPRSRTGLWDINSIGRVTADGHTYLLAVVSDGNKSMSSGITLVEKAAKAAVAALRTGT